MRTSTLLISRRAKSVGKFAILERTRTSSKNLHHRELAVGSRWACFPASVTPARVFLWEQSREPSPDGAPRAVSRVFGSPAVRREAEEDWGGKRPGRH